MHRTYALFISAVLVAHVLFSDSRISVGARHSLLLRDNGELYAYGTNEEGQLGIRNVDSLDAFDRVEPLKVLINRLDTDTGLSHKVIAIASGEAHNLALISNNAKSGIVYAWGRNTDKQCGIYSGVPNIHIPTIVKQLPDNISSIAAGHNHSLAVTDTGELWVWGSNEYNQIGLTEEGLKAHNKTFEKISLYPTRLIDSVECGDVAKVYAAANASALINSDGNVFLWGKVMPSLDPIYMIRVPGMIDSPVRELSIGDAGFHFLYLHKNGSVSANGINESGELGYSADTGINPVVFSQPYNHTFDDAVAVSAGMHSSFILHEGSAGKKLSVFGNKLSDDSFFQSNDIASIISSYSRTYIIRTDGKIIRLGDQLNKSHNLGPNEIGEVSASAQASPSIRMISPGNLSIHEVKMPASILLQSETLEGDAVKVDYFLSGESIFEDYKALFLGTSNTQANGFSVYVNLAKMNLITKNKSSEPYFIFARAVNQNGDSSVSEAVEIHIEGDNRPPYVRGIRTAFRSLDDRKDYYKVYVQLDANDLDGSIEELQLFDGEKFLCSFGPVENNLTDLSAYYKGKLKLNKEYQLRLYDDKAEYSIISFKFDEKRNWIRCLQLALNGTVMNQNPPAIRLSWSSPANGNNRDALFKIYRKQLNETEWILIDEVLSVNGYIDNSVRSGASYIYKVIKEYFYVNDRLLDEITAYAACTINNTNYRSEKALLIARDFDALLPADASRYSSLESIINIFDNYLPEASSSSPDFRREIQRNSQCWASGLDLSGISPWNSDGYHKRAGTLVSRRHIVFAMHYSIPVGTDVLFVDNRGNSETYRIIESTRIGGRWSSNPQVRGPDVEVALLDREISDNIKSYKVMPADWQEYLTRLDMNHMPILVLDQEEKAIVHELGYYNYPAYISHVPPINENRRPFYEATDVKGDSGNPSFLIVNGEPILLLTHTLGGEGPDYSRLIDDINFIMNEQAAGYKLELLDLNTQ